MEAKERRFLARWQINYPVRIKLAGAESYTDCCIHDLNLKGLQISLDLRLPKDARISFSLFLAKDFEVNIEAWIVWHKTLEKQNSYGLYFTKINDKDKEKLYKFVCKFRPGQIKNQYCQNLDAQEKGGEDMPEAHFEDKRIFERFAACFPLRFINLRSNAEGQGQTKDVNAKGVGLVTSEKLQPRTPVEMWLEIPDHGEPFYTRGEVVWSNMVSPNEYRAGVNLEKADLMGLSRVLRLA